MNAHSERTRANSVFLTVIVFVAVLAIFSLVHQTAHAVDLPWFGGAQNKDVALQTTPTPTEDTAQGTGFLAMVWGFLIKTFSGIAIGMATIVLQLILTINTTVVQSFAVRTGFGVSLAVANLGFVIGIIVIAIATILRSQTYGMKQTLWKFIAMAILVNFGLPIAGAILSVANGLTAFFISQSVGGAGTNAFADALIGAFQPQRFIVDATSLGGNQPSWWSVLGSSLSGDFSHLVIALMNLIFPVVFLIVILMVVLAMIAMFVIRYIYISFLLILLPLAWVSWVFPLLRTNWDRWWRQFLRWTFFAPISVFFLYLAIATLQQMNANANDPIQRAVVAAATTGSALDAFKSFFAGAVVSIMTALLQMVVMVGLAAGGLVAANSFGIHFANTAISATKAAVTNFGGYVGRRTSGAVARSATSAPPASGAKGWLTTPLRKIIQSPAAQSYGVTKAVSTYGAKTDFGVDRNVRLAAKQKFADATKETDPVRKAQLQKEAGALVSLAAQRRAENPGLARSVFGGAANKAGLWKPEKKSVSGAELKTLRDMEVPRIDAKAPPSIIQRIKDVRKNVAGAVPFTAQNAERRVERIEAGLQAAQNIAQLQSKKGGDTQELIKKLAEEHGVDVGGKKEEPKPPAPTPEPVDKDDASRG